MRNINKDMKYSKINAIFNSKLEKRIINVHLRNVKYAMKIK